MFTNKKLFYFIHYLCLYLAFSIYLIKTNIHMNPIHYNTISHPCPCCCSAYMEEHETYWVCPVCGAVVDKG